MAGGHSVLEDPAIKRYSYARESAWKHFRWTPQTVKIGIWTCLIIPVGIFSLASWGDRKFRVVGTRRDQSVFRNGPSQAPEVTDE